MCKNGTFKSIGLVAPLYDLHFDVQLLIFLLILMAHY